ncbi:hypothetical protein GO755_22680 [Spirosoma sp. HMF4905]|uniref:Uncharacterized protein n=1 Tax=Spirosoma arboris TaxID=2682092 RepID=A0A7K1SGI9_9BACT|nr:hypothetical protein [Spirosoma arboris]MVM32863.1 hypothetical protein [Spirosoma arboris]
MKIRLTGNKADFKKIEPILTANRAVFDSYRKPQKGNNPLYKEGGDKYDPKAGEQLLMYLDIPVDAFVKMLKK